jgi:hypothetical protein
MGISVFPASSGGGIKSVQRGAAVGSGNITITAVDVAKSFVTVFGTASSGTVAATGAVGAQNGNIAAHNITFNGGGTTARQDGSPLSSVPITATTFSSNSSNITGGTNNLVAAIVQGFLANSTTLTVSGACRYEVVEFA